MSKGDVTERHQRAPTFTNGARAQKGPLPRGPSTRRLDQGPLGRLSHLRVEGKEHAKPELDRGELFALVAVDPSGREFAVVSHEVEFGDLADHAAVRALPE